MSGAASAILLVLIIMAKAKAGKVFETFEVADGFDGLCDIRLADKPANTHKDFICSRFGAKLWLQSLGGQDGFCVSELICSEGSYVSINGSCESGLPYCSPDGGFISEVRDLFSGNCSDETLKNHQEGDCSRDIQSEACKKGFFKEVNEVTLLSGEIIRLAGVRRFVRDLDHGEYIQVGRTGPIHGTRDYCTRYDHRSDCHRWQRSPNTTYRMVSDKQTFPTFWVDDCVLRARSHRSVLVKVPDDTSSYKVNMTLIGFCLKDRIVVETARFLKQIKVCGRFNCMVEKSAAIESTFHRSRPSQMFDSSVRITIRDLSSSQTKRIVVPCDKFTYCQTLTCVWCVDRLWNPSCYTTTQSIISLVLLYAGVFVIFFLVFLLRILVWPCRMAHRLFKARGKARNSDKDKVSDDIELSTLGEKKRLLRTKARDGLVISSVILYLICLTSGEECSTNHNIAIQGIACDINKLQCDPWTELDISLSSRQEVSCVTILDGDQILGLFQLELISVVERCEKDHKYWTADVVYNTDSVVHCPGVENCSPGWCMSVDNNTTIREFPHVGSSFQQGCNLGDACWLNGCLLCTHSCHTTRHRPQRKNGLIMEVFDCPSSTFEAQLKFRLGESNWTMAVLRSGQTIPTGFGIWIRVELGHQSRLMGGNYLTDGLRVTGAEVSSPGLPVAGTVGSLQCSDANAVKSLNCNFGPRTCHCKPTPDADYCSCVTVDLEGLLTVGTRRADYYMETGVLTREVDPYDSVKVVMRSKLSFEPRLVEPDSCIFFARDVVGCYSCSRGAELAYHCVSKSPQVVLLRCQGVTTPVFCGLNTTSHTVMKFEEAEGIYDCSVPCQKEPFSLEFSLTEDDLYEAVEDSTLNFADKFMTFYKRSWYSGTGFVKTNMLLILIELIGLTLALLKLGRLWGGRLI